MKSTCQNFWRAAQFNAFALCKDGYSFKGTQISRDYSFGKLNARFEGTENHVSSRANSTLQYEQGDHKSNHEPSMSESSQDTWDGISSIGLFAPANAQTFEREYDCSGNI